MQGLQYLKHMNQPFYIAVALYLVSSLSGEQNKDFLSNIFQLTFEGNRSGEGYFSSSGSKICYQAEAFPGNPFYQIYQLNLENGSNSLVSSGVGKTTCAWFHPKKEAVLYASTHHDLSSLEKQKNELQSRKDGLKKKYSWDYDKMYELYVKDLLTGDERRLTHNLGYDAECAFSPDGSKIVFTSNRHFYESNDSTDNHNISIYNELYLMDYETGKVERLTNHLGYDGGPFFDYSGEKVCWRRFSPDGHNAEIYVMSLKTRKERKITHLNAMSWAPFFHPSDKYIIFSTNLHGFQNFELYIVDTAGEKVPIRITNREGFDSLPTFSPDGNTISWTSNSTPTKKSQIFIADWNHDLAMLALQESPQRESNSSSVLSVPYENKVNISEARNHVNYLSSSELEGRYTGSKGMKKANQYVANYFEKHELLKFDSQSWYQDFTFFKSAKISDESSIKSNASQENLKLKKDWSPLGFSESGKGIITQLVFAGYGLRIPETADFGGYDSYTHLEVKDNWIVCLRKLPPQWNQEKKDKFYYHSTLRKKASVARDLGAKGIIFVSDSNESEGKLISFDQSTRETISIHALSVSRRVIEKIFSVNNRDFNLQSKLFEKGDLRMGYTLKNIDLTYDISIIRNKGICQNTIGYLDSNNNNRLDKPYILIGAHMDHVGRGQTGSRASKKDKGKVHPGADDNGSGVSALLEIIRLLKLDPRILKNLNFDIVLATWSGEEIGLVGSSHYATQLKAQNHGKQRAVLAYLNMDMIGRLKDKLTIHGVGSSSHWRKIIQKANIPLRINLNLQNDSHIPTDTTSFYAKGIPILSAFTGLHDDYHSPTDSADKINYQGIDKCAQLFTRIITTLSDNGEIDYISQSAPSSSNRAKLRAYLGTIPNYSQTDQKGVLLSGVAQNGPADLAGLESGDLIIELSGSNIENIYDYTEAIGKIKPGKKHNVKVMRNGNLKTLTIIPKAR